MKKKQELIQFVTQQQKNIDKLDFTDVEDSDRADYLANVMYVNYKNLLDEMEKLDEPQKVKMPERVVKWLKYCKRNNYPLSAATYDKNIKSFEKASNQTKILEWFDTVQNQDEFARAWLDGYEVEESKWVVNEGDLVIRKGEHDAKVYFVESVDDDGILLVNGIKDEFFTDLDERSVGEESINYFYENFKLLAKKENLEVEKVQV